MVDLNNNTQTEPITLDDCSCPICYDKMDEDVVKLICGHSFHYTCILEIYKAKYTKNKNSRYVRTCPYCRQYGGYLPLKNNIFPLKKIHEEYNELEKYLDLNDFKTLKELSKKYMDSNKCQTILKSGVNRGYQCKKKCGKDSKYCSIHKAKNKE